MKKLNPTPEHRNILEEANEITHGERLERYGPPEENFQRISEIASAITGKEMTAEDCVFVLMAVKLARLRTSPDHRDSIVDVAGYAWCLAKVANVD